MIERRPVRPHHALFGFAALLLAVSLALGEETGGDDAPMETPAAPSSGKKTALRKPSYPVSGSIDLRLRWRKTVRDEDMDITGSVSLQAGDPSRHVLTGYLSGAVYYDLDGHQDTYGINSLDSPQDVYSNAATGHLHNGYIDINRILLFQRIRIGRQFSAGGVSVRFDGVRVDTKNLLLDVLRGVRITARAFGGVPVHLWEPSPAGDACGGFGMKALLGRFLEGGLDLIWLRDRSKLWGRTEVTQDTLVALSARWLPHDHLTVHGRITLLSPGTSDAPTQPSDVVVSGVGRVPEWGISGTADFTARLKSRDDPAAELNPYDAVMGSDTTYQRGSFSLVKSLGKNFEVEIGGTFYNGVGGSGIFDRDMTGAHLTLRTSGFLREELQLSATVETWEPSGKTFK
ncbi:MAG: hypothetical protein ACYS47_14120 [Planctomycetota bacterium]